MKQDNPYYPLLRERVESVLRRKMKTNGDFIFLATHIFLHSHSTISPTTLKRFWGTIEQSENKKGIRIFTLDLLAKICGYVDFTSFCEDVEGAANGVLGSAPCLGQLIKTSSLSTGCTLRLMWKPNRCVTVVYEGMETFRVTESTGSKIREGATFQCLQFVEGESLILSNLINPGENPTNYACAKLEGGLHIEY